MADYYRYNAEYAYGEQYEDSAQKARTLYETATTIAKETLLPTDPLRLHVAINESAFYFEILSFPYHAYRVSRQAVDDARSCAIQPQTKEQRQEYNTLTTILSRNIRTYQVEIVQRLQQVRRYPLDYFQEEAVIDQLRQCRLFVSII